jgi:acyl-CoA hydrolase
MIVGIRVESENIQTGKVKHCNSSYFTMVAKDTEGKNIEVPGLIIASKEEVRRFWNCIKMIALKKDKDRHEEHFDYLSSAAMEQLRSYRIQLEDF